MTAKQGIVRVCAAGCLAQHVSFTRVVRFWTPGAAATSDIHHVVHQLLSNTHAGKEQRLWGNPAWKTHIWGLATWAAINGGLWFCFVWWIIGRTRLVWIVCAVGYASVIAFHGVISSRFGCDFPP